MTTRDLLMHGWEWNTLALAGCAAAIALYARAVDYRFTRRAVWLACAVIAVLLALTSPIDVLANGFLFSAHMVQHLLLVLVAPPLALMSLPPNLKIPGRIGEILGRAAPGPKLGWIMGVSAMWIWHAPTFCNAATGSPSVHALQTLSLLAMGTAFWWPILAPSQSHRLAPLTGAVYMFAGCIGCTLLGILIAFSPVEICSAYMGHADPIGIQALVREGWGMSCKNDQEIGGLLMWVPACSVYAGSILALLARFYASDGREERA